MQTPRSHHTASQDPRQTCKITPSPSLSPFILFFFFFRLPFFLLPLPFSLPLLLLYIMIFFIIVVIIILFLFFLLIYIIITIIYFYHFNDRFNSAVYHATCCCHPSLPLHASLIVCFNFSSPEATPTLFR